jgi:hypothetical protein
MRKRTRTRMMMMMSKMRRRIMMINNMRRKRTMVMMRSFSKIWRTRMMIHKMLLPRLQKRNKL